MPCNEKYIQAVGILNYSIKFTTVGSLNESFNFFSMANKTQTKPSLPQLFSCATPALKFPCPQFLPDRNKNLNVRIWTVHGRHYHQSGVLSFILLCTDQTSFLNTTPGNCLHFPHLTVTYSDSALGIKGAKFILQSNYLKVFFFLILTCLAFLRCCFRLFVAIAFK